ncbi:ABC transporter ATP-binding protein [Pseudonocardia spinosispora]|uniref:ABC transporter ATP-binding protein n=1 Tax=Pseudonocardia spinosispora TaxID=103441 RepID=UPI0003F885B1|nr:ABC transporter ATP-binding protein [Pseudonocardia spinosispora]
MSAATDVGERRPDRERAVLPRLIALFRPERTRVVIASVVGTLSVALLVVGPALLGRATDILFDGIVGARLRPGDTKDQAVADVRAHGHDQLANMLTGMDLHPGTGVDLGRIGRVLGLVALAYLLSALFSWLQARLLTGTAQRTMYELRKKTEEKLTRLPVRYFDSQPRGEILSRVINDIDNINTALQEGLSQFPTLVLTVAGTLIIMFWISPLLAVVSVVTIPVVMVVTVLIARRSKVRFTAQWSQTGELTSMIEESYAGHALVLAYGQRESMTTEFGSQNDRLLRAGFAAQFLSGAIFPAVVFVGNLNYVLVAAVGGLQVAAGVISLGAVQAFIQYAQRFTSPLIQIAGQTNVLQSGIVSAGRVFELLDAPEEPVLPPLPTAHGDGATAPVRLSPVRPASVARRLSLDGVSFRYEPDTPLIEDLTLEVAPGQTVAIVGPTGAGKTTLVNLLVRFYEISGGRILLDGVDYRELSRDQVRACFGMVLQDTWLFHGTIRDNIAYGKEGARDRDILDAARAAHVDDFVRTLPDAYDTVLQDDASNISTGQKQLVTIARAFLSDPGILILDEATSNVDTRTETMIQAAMARLQHGRTSFVIAHRLSTIHAADTILVMEAGRIVEQGAHQELLDRRGFYHDLYTSQFTHTLTR